jgi:mannose/fructose/N-acetylgalactosamine-specific phosphotransferase system component IIC
MAPTNKFSSEILRLEQEKEQLIKEKRALRKKIGVKKRKISELHKQVKKAESTGQKPRLKSIKNSFISLKLLLFLPVLTITIVLSLIYMNRFFPFANLDFLSTYYHLVIPFIIFSVSLACLVMSFLYFTFYKLIQNSGKAKHDKSLKEREPLEWSQAMSFIAFLCVVFVLFSCLTIITTIGMINQIFRAYPSEWKSQFYPLIIGFWCSLWGGVCIKSYFMIK